MSDMLNWAESRWTAEENAYFVWQYTNLKTSYIQCFLIWGLNNNFGTSCLVPFMQQLQVNKKITRSIKTRCKENKPEHCGLTILIIAYRCFQSLGTKTIYQPHGIGWVKFDDLSSFVQMWRTLFTLVSCYHISHKHCLRPLTGLLGLSCT